MSGPAFRQSAPEANRAPAPRHSPACHPPDAPPRCHSPDSAATTSPRWRHSPRRSRPPLDRSSPLQPRLRPAREGPRNTLAPSMLASSPASILNQTRAFLGTPSRFRKRQSGSRVPDRFSSRNTAGVQSVARKQDSIIPIPSWRGVKKNYTKVTLWVKENSGDVEFR